MLRPLAKPEEAGKRIVSAKEFYGKLLYNQHITLEQLIGKRCSPIAFGHDGVTLNRLFFTNQFVIVMEPIDVQ